MKSQYKKNSITKIDIGEVEIFPLVLTTSLLARIENGAKCRDNSVNSFILSCAVDGAKLWESEGLMKNPSTGAVRMVADFEGSDTPKGFADLVREFKKEGFVSIPEGPEFDIEKSPDPALVLDTNNSGLVADSTSDERMWPTEDEWENVDEGVSAGERVKMGFTLEMSPLQFRALNQLSHFLAITKEEIISSALVTCLDGRNNSDLHSFQAGMLEGVAIQFPEREPALTLMISAENLAANAVGFSAKTREHAMETLAGSVK